MRLKFSLECQTLRDHSGSILTEAHHFADKAQIFWKFPEANPLTGPRRRCLSTVVLTQTDRVSVVHDIPVLEVSGLRTSLRCHVVRPPRRGKGKIAGPPFLWTPVVKDGLSSDLLTGVSCRKYIVFGNSALRFRFALLKSFRSRFLSHIAL